MSRKNLYLFMRLNTSNCDVIINNATVVGNFISNPWNIGGPMSIADGANVQIYNSIFYNNTPRHLYSIATQYESSHYYINNSLIEGGQSSVIAMQNPNALVVHWGEGNLNTNPLFDNSDENFPCQLSENSPAIDAGTLDLPEGYTLPTTDIMGNPRISGATIDMGAYEYQMLYANFSAFPLSGEAPLEVQFTDLSTGGVFEWQWDFDLTGDNISSEQNPVHTYTEAGTYSVRLIINLGEKQMIKQNYITVTPATSEKEASIIVYQTALKGNYPNPFNPETKIDFSLAKSGWVKIEVFNIKGQKIAVLVDEGRKAGNHSITWKGIDLNGQSVGSGVYYYRMKAGDYIGIDKMILLK
jgi:PKD repeat protein